jgi:DedD protein
MNPELKQRLIGAVVVTALAAIFVPMLFDDPVENSSQSVSELVIPATPVNTGEESANKLPTSANQVLNTPDAGSKTVVNTEEESELSTNKQLPSDEPLDDEPVIETVEGVEQPVDEPNEPIDERVNDKSSTSLDTGDVDVSKKPVKTKQKTTAKPPMEPEAAVATPKKPAKKTETSTSNQAAKMKPLTAASVEKSEKPLVKPAKSSSELTRWTVQAGTFSKKENAVSLMESLRKQGLPVTLEATKGSGNSPLYRLKVGPALDKKRAAEMKAKLDSQKIQSILIAE